MSNQATTFSNNAILSKAAYVDLHEGMTRQQVYDALVERDIFGNQLFTAQEANDFVINIEL